MQRGSPGWGLTRPNDFLNLDPGSLNFTGEFVHGLAGVLICVGVHVELRLGEFHCQVSKGREEISSSTQPHSEVGAQELGVGQAGAGLLGVTRWGSPRKPKALQDVAIQISSMRVTPPSTPS